MLRVVYCCARLICLFKIVKRFSSVIKMPPKGRGRKRAVAEEIGSADSLLKVTNSNGHVEVDNLDILEKKSDANISDGDKLGEINEVLANGKSQINGASEKDSNLIADDEQKLESKEVPLKRGRPKKVVAKASEETPDDCKQENAANIGESSKSGMPDVNESNDIGKAEVNTEVDISDKNKIEKREVPLKRGRQKKVVANASEENPDDNKQDSNVANIDESPKSNTPADDVDKDIGKTEIDTEVDISDKNKIEKQVPLKRGRAKKVVANTSEENSVDCKQENNDANIAESPKSGTGDDKNKNEKQEVPLKRGRPKKVISKASEECLDEQISDKNEPQSKDLPLKRGRPKKNLAQMPEETPDEKLNTKEPIQSHRGRKRAEQEDINEGKASSVTKQENNDASDPEEQKIPPKRGRKKGNQKETVADLSDKESGVSALKHSEDLIEEEKSDEVLSVGSKRKNETSTEEVEKNKSDFNETKVLKVALQRSVSIDKMFEEQTKVAEKGGAKNTKKEADSEEDDVKSPKIPKGESKSKGQSKKDKMPDVTLLDFSNNSTSPSGKPWNLKISSWNVNGVRAWLEKDGLAYITHEDPDIMAFQETKCSDKMLPNEVNITGYHSYWLAGDKDGYSGVGLLSKKEPISVKYGIGVEEHDSEGRVITAEYETFYLVTTYVPNAGRGLVRLNYRMDWDKDFRSYLKSLDEKKPVVLCGDLNVAHEEIDLANPKSNKKNAGFTKEEREGFSTLLSEGFIDSFRHLYPDEKGAYTFWTYMMNARAKNVGWRLDYFVLSKKFSDHLCDSVIRKDVYGGDHCPITLFLYI